MTCFLTCMFTLLPLCLISSKAMLSPPRHLTVGLLDFKATAEWLPGQGNPPESRFTLDFIPAKNMSFGKWIRSPNCTDTDVLKCELTFDQQPYDLHWNYFVRVKSTFKGTSSNWTTTSKSFQPYGDTRLSSPDVKISTEQKSINISFSHWLELNPGTKPLEYLLYLFENSPVGESKLVALISTSKSPYIFNDLPSGKNYCISVSASHQKASKNNFNTTKCISLDSSRSFVLLVWIVAMLLITFSAGIVLTFVCSHHLRPKIKNLRIPKSLINISVTNWVLKLMPDEINILIWQKPVTNPADCASASDVYSKDGFSFYHQRENLTNTIINSSFTANVNPAEQAEEAETSYQCYKYTLATDMEERDGSVSEKGDDSMYSGSFEFLSACASNNVRLSEILPAISVNMFVRERYCEEETVSCSSANDCERELPIEEDEDEEDIFMLPDYSESGYEPR